jgi:hypothetical protein
MFLVWSENGAHGTDFSKMRKADQLRLFVVLGAQLFLRCGRAFLADEGFVLLEELFGLWRF